MKGPDIGEVWIVDLNDNRGHEQAGTRPAVILAVSCGMRIAVPFTTSERASSFPHTHFLMPDENNGYVRKAMH
jgi:mRNA interferase MazF